jgi:NhaA family Na+:H+ antiporter
MVIKYVQDTLDKFVKYQAAGGVLLLIASLFAIISANSQFAHTYHHFLETPFLITLGGVKLGHNIETFVNDGLMVIFFLLVSLEIKREVIEGNLSSRDQQITPVVGALGGVIVPALIYLLINFNQNIVAESTIKGWAIPSATDIAFAIGVISLFGKRVPGSLKVFLLALAIIDDLIAIIIIALFYNADLSVVFLLLALAIMIGLITMNKLGVINKSLYFIAGFFLWLAVLQSGIHATIAGVLLGLVIPLRAKDENGLSPLKVVEHSLESWVAFAILPIFAFCNAGVDLSGMNFTAIFSNPVSLGIILGLFIGKQLGVFGTLFILIKLGLAKMPQNSNWMQVYGVSALTGIGFTMSIFIGNLAFTGQDQILNDARIGILFASLLAALLGYVILHLSSPKDKS